MVSKATTTAPPANPAVPAGSVTPDRVGRRGFRPPWRARLHWRLILAIGIPLVLVEGLRMVVGYQDDRAEAQKQVRAYLTEVTQHHAEAVASRLAQVMQATRTGAWFLASGQVPYDHASLRAVVAGVVEQSPLIYGSAVAFAPASGHGAYYARRIAGGIERIDYAGRGVDYSRQDWYTHPLQQGSPWWSPPYFDRGIGEARMVTYSVPWTTAGGKAAAVLTADIEVGTLDIDWSSPWGGATRIVDAQGHYIAEAGDVPTRFDGVFDAAKALGIVGLDAAARDMVQGGSGILRTHDPRADDQAVWVSWAPISGTGWSLMALLYEDRVLASAREQLLHQILLSLSALVLVLVTLVWVTRRLTRPLDSLRRVARAVRHGDHTQRTGMALSRDEIGQFAHAFDAMLDDLQATQAERLHEAERRQRIEGELATAREIQRRLLPPDWPEWSRRAGPTPGLEFHGLCEPATLMSGDFYDVFMLDGECVALVVADVCGKGAAAALYMAIVYTRLRDFARADRSPAQTLAAINRSLVEEGHDGMFVTLFLGHYHWRDGRLTYACAGHPPPLLARAGGAVELLEVRGGLVGAFVDIDYADATAVLAPGDTLLAYSDGITEAGLDRDALYGIARLQDRLGELATSPTPALCDALVADVLAYADDAPGDDITLLAVRRTPA